MIETLIELATEAGITIRRIYESGKFSTFIKSDRTPVTTADEEANKMILKGLIIKKRKVFLELLMRYQLYFLFLLFC